MATLQKKQGTPTHGDKRKVSEKVQFLITMSPVAERRQDSDHIAPHFHRKSKTTQPPKFHILDFLKVRHCFKKKRKQKKTFINDTNLKKSQRSKSRKYKSQLRKKILESRQARRETKDDCTNENAATSSNQDSQNDQTTIEDLQLKPQVQPPKAIHSLKYRSYCDNLTSNDLNKEAELFIRELYRLQCQLYERDQVKGRARRRYVLGFKEVLRKLEINKIKIVIIATDCEKCELPDGVEDVIRRIKEKCISNEVNYVFCLRRRQLSYLLHKKALISCCGVISYEGIEEIHQRLIVCAKTERENYAKAISS